MKESAPLANPDNAHNPADFGSDQGSVTGDTVISNTNIDRDAPAKPPHTGVQGGAGRRTRRRRKRGGGYGFNPKGTPAFGVMPIKSYPGCGVPKSPDLGVGTQFVGSPPPQRGGKRSNQSAVAPASSAKFGPFPAPPPKHGLPVQSGGGRTSGSCGNCGGTPYYGYTKAVPGLTNYAPVTAECHKQCGGRRRTKRRRRRRRTKRRRTKRRRRRRRTRRNTRRRVRRRTRRRQRGGYDQFGSNIPSTPGYATPNGGNWQTANPPTYARNDACGSGNCVDNYNHFTGKGFASPILDGDVNPPPPPPNIKTPNNTAQCGGKKRRRRRRRRR